LDALIAETPKLLTAQDVAKILQCSERFAYNLISTGALKSLKMGRLVRVRQTDLKTFIEKNVN
jgi:excisionase family DNA binding protein